MHIVKKSKPNKRNYGQGVVKSDLFIQLFHLQEPVCPLCKRSLLAEIKTWMAWKEKQLVNGKRVRRKDANINIDHIIPVADGGTNDISNLALTHRRCNDIRGTVMLYNSRPEREQGV